VILFGRNVQSPTQVLALTEDLQRSQSADQLPLLIAVDQEGGRVARLQAPFTTFPSAWQVGKTGSALLAFDSGYALGRELHAVGINMNMAPVLDVLTNPTNPVIGDRAFGADPHMVALSAGAFMRGMQAAGVLAVGKHFPGHGDTRLDSHLALPVCERSLAQLEACELWPFHQAIATGLQAIMTAHVIYPAWDASRPATLSTAMLTGVLRGELGFPGLIISDDLGMAAVTEAAPWEEVPWRALRAGVDLLLVCHQRQQQEHAFASLLHAVQSGDLPEIVVDRAVGHVHTFKSQLQRRTRDVSAPSPLHCIGCREHQTLAAKIAELSTRQMKGKELDVNGLLVG
jgi:beta-N-acetylhexosaminidase